VWCSLVCIPLRPQADSQIGAEYSGEIIRQIKGLPVCSGDCMKAIAEQATLHIVHEKHERHEKTLLASLLKFSTQ
jgi:hypothetical protein